MKKLLLFITLFILASSVFGQDVSVIENLVPKTAVSSADTPYIYSSIIIKTGAVSEAGYNAGMSVFISKLLLLQTRNRSKEDIQRIFEETGCSLSLEANPDYIEIKTITAKENFPEALNIIAECLTECRITPDQIKKAKAETVENMTEEYDHPFQRLYDTLKQNIYLSNPYKRGLYGTVQSIKNIDKNSITKYYRENFSVSNTVITVVGNITEAEVRKTVENAFALGYKNKKRGIIDYNDTNEKNKRVTITNYDPEDPLTYYVRGYLFPGMTDRDYYPALVLSAILGEGKSCEVFRNIRQKYGIGYLIGFKYEKLRRQSHAYLYISALDEDNVKLNIIREEFVRITDRIKNEGVSEEDLNRAKKYITEQENIKNLDLMNRTHNISFNLCIYDSIENFTDFEEKVNSVSCEDIKKMAKKYLTSYCEIISEPKKENKK